MKRGCLCERPKLSILGNNLARDRRGAVTAAAEFFMMFGNFEVGVRDGHPTSHRVRVWMRLIRHVRPAVL
ncbi:hypothetical protein MK139_04025 [bacterium]|nr:hypothetical protein [bacterium]